MKITAATLLLAFLALGSPAQPQEAIGKPAHANRIEASTSQERAESLRAVFIAPAIAAYLNAHKEDVSLTDAESESIIAAYNALRECKPELGLQEMKPPFDRAFAQMVGGSMKAQRFIYLHHGRGRLLFQQAGVEAFDATLRLILQLEERGDIRFDSLADRELALAYWTTQDHSSFLLPDPGEDQAFQLDALMLECP